jgi:hypothetical protein
VRANEKPGTHPRRSPRGAGAGASAARPHPDVMSRQMGDGAVLIHLGTNRIYETNATGARIWELLSAGCDRDEVIHRLIAEYEIDEPTVVNQVDEMMGVLLAEGLFRRGESNE